MVIICKINMVFDIERLKLELSEQKQVFRLFIHNSDS